MENEAHANEPETEALPPEPPKIQEAPPSWDRWDTVFLLTALLAAGCYFFAHFPYIWQDNGHVPGAGLTLTQGLLTAAALLAAGKKGRLRVKGNPGGVFLLIFALGLGVTFSLTGCDSLRLMNLPVVHVSTALALFSLTGVNPLPALSGPGLYLGLRRFVPGFFRRWFFPFRALKGAARRGRRETWRGLAAGVALGLPVVIAAALLLSSADQVFGSLWDAGTRRLMGLNGETLIRTVYTLMGGLCLYSFLRTVQESAFTPREPKERSVPAVTLMTVLSMLALVYAVFSYIQFRCLFFGAQETAAREGYAEYARSGFFQLVLLAVLTLILILPFLALGKESTGVRWLCALVAALTVVIDVSAFLRMRLYIEAYGLSLLRLVTLWGMLMILLALTGCLMKCVRPGLRICPVLAAAALSTWLLLNLGGMDRMVARWQVDAYNRGTIAELDISYLISLSPGVLPELARIEDPIFRQETEARAQEAFTHRYPCPYDWSMCWLRAR